MPNGSDANWGRLCMAVDGFRGKYNRWPTRIILYTDTYYSIRRILGPKSFSILQKHLELIPDEDAEGISAEDNSERQFLYGKDMDSYKDPDITLKSWLGIDSLPDYQD